MNLFTIGTEPTEYESIRPLSCALCKNDLYLTRFHTIPLYASDNEPEHYEVGCAITNSWRVECMDGHVLAFSQAEENAEPFTREALTAGYRYEVPE